MGEPSVRRSWEDHGWWLTADESNRAVLWTTIYPITKGHHATAIGKKFGDVTYLRTQSSHKLYITYISEPSAAPQETTFSKRLLMKPVPTVLLTKSRVLKLLDAVKRA